MWRCSKVKVPRTCSGTRGVPLHRGGGYNYSHNFLYGYGVEGRRSVVQWPFLRVFWSGFFMVAIFFVISGYVLWYKPLRQISARQAAQLQHALASPVFRRAIRLYLPSMIAVVICGLLTWTGAFTYATSVTHSEKATPFPTT